MAATAASTLRFCHVTQAPRMPMGISYMDTDVSLIARRIHDVS